MLVFVIHFFICNIFIAALTGIILAVKRLLNKHLSGRVQYNIWFLILALLTVPFLPFRAVGLLPFSPWVNKLTAISSQGINMVSQAASSANTPTMNWMNDFSVSVTIGSTSTLGILLMAIWLIGILAMILLAVKSKIHFYYLEQSALPLQNHKVHTLFEKCKVELELDRNIPIYSTAFLRSPFTAGLIKPRIYLPIHLISDFNAGDMRFILLHELQHCKHKDAFVNHLMNLAVILYWFNPLVWYALGEMRNDREIACDSSVLQMLDKNEYENYGTTLINFAEKISLAPFPFATGMGGNMEQIKKRILNIASYEPQSLGKRILGVLIYSLIAVILLGFAPVLSIYADGEDGYPIHETQENISYMDLSSHFKEYNGTIIPGSFVLYDDSTDTWTIYNEKSAAKRIAPDSTYKIYDALLGLESGIITPLHSQMVWNGEDYPFDAWESNQDLTKAMNYSVNWYFQTIDTKAGTDKIKSFLQEIGYGNQTISNDLELYWADSSLKISPIEQVGLLKRFNDNEFHFADQNIDTVKNSICLTSTSAGSIYGKTGTGRVNGKDINGWFIGYVEKNNHVYYFATNIQNDANATGSKATKITESILSDLQIWIE